MKKKYITYKINITCEVNKFGAVIPIGSETGVQSADKKDQNMTRFPAPEKIMQIWIGKFFQYPRIEKL